VLTDGERRHDGSEEPRFVGRDVTWAEWLRQPEI
jgi:hypothetical protein